ncbi:MAG: hypothetical protein U0Q18_24190 [Bryobacteraceae bacterium]
MKRTQWLSLVEPGIVFCLIMLYIWRLRYTSPRAWVYILAVIVVSHVLHHERGPGLGFRWTNFKECMETWSPVLLFLALLLISGGLLLQTIRKIGMDHGILCFVAYCPWGLFQQYLLNGYFANRLLAFSSARHVPLIAAALFSGTHSPNWFLMLVTFVAGYCSTKIYMRYRNMYFLGLAHGTIGSLLFLVIPDSISHHLVIGPGFFLR